MSGAPLLRVSGLVKAFRVPRGRREGGDPFRLGPVDLDVAPGDRIALVGPNGAGKTTLLRLLAGVYRPDGGRIERPARVTPVIDGISPFPVDLTVREHVRAHAAVRGRPVGIDEVLAFAGLEPLADRPVRRLSTGQRARLALGCGIHEDADLYLVDEALAVCDPAFRAAAMGRLRDRSAAGAAVLLAGQDMMTAAALCERGVHLDGGRVRFEGPVDDALRAYTGASRGGAVPSPSGSREPILVSADVVSRDERTVVVRVAALDRAIGAELALAVKSGADEVRFTARVPLTPAARSADGTVAVEVGIPAACLGPPPARLAVVVFDPDGTALDAREGALALDGASAGPETPPAHSRSTRRTTS